jgi:hypothetical protein
MHKIAIFDDEPEKVQQMADTLSKLGFEVKVFGVEPRDTETTIASRIKAFDPDMIYADYSLHSEFNGYDVLRAVGGKFWAPGNPRVVSISSVPRGAMSDVAGAHFPHKQNVHERITRFEEAFVAFVQGRHRLQTA